MMNSTPAPHPLDGYRQLLRDILDHGVRRPNRTGEDTLFLPGAMLKFDMREGFPVFTARKFAFKSMVGELLGFFRGYSSAADFRALGCKVWDANANSTPGWLANPNRKGVDDIGRAYGVQWTDWKDWRVAQSDAEAQRLAQQGYSCVLEGHRFDEPAGVYCKGVNQLEQALRTILTDPTSRRNIITAWRPDEHDRMALPACHTNYTWLCDTESRILHLTTEMRSWDTVLAFNIQLSSLFLHIMARLAGYTPGTVTLFVADAHVYLNHVPGLSEMLQRQEHPLPQLGMSPRLQALTPDGVPGVFSQLQPADFWLEGYAHEPPIAFQMAA